MEVFIIGIYDEDEDIVYCENCEKKMRKKVAIYVGGRPYCKKCYRDAEEYETIDVYEDDYDEEEDDDD
ncbi:MAG: hypothetical protein ACFFDY_02300, partial [Candidatus Thorarchaeota archaeon]